MPALAEEALAAGNSEGHNYAMANFEICNLRSDLDHLAHGLVAENIAMLHLWNDTVEDVEIRATDSASGHLDDGVARLFDLGVRYALAAHVSLSMPSKCFHTCFLEARPARVLAFNGRQNGRFHMRAKWVAPYVLY